MEFAIKVYRDSPEYPNMGKFTQFLEKSIKVGRFIWFEGPYGKIVYHGLG